MRGRAICFFALLLTVVPVVPVGAALPGRNGLLAYGSIRGGEDLEIVTSRSDGRGARTLTRNDAFDICASWSPDGELLLFCRLGKNGFDLWVMNRDGSGQTNLTRTPGVDETFGSFSPDGGRIAYMRFLEGTGTDIWLMDADGGSPVQVTSGPGEDWRPVWAPNGDSLLFERDVVEGDELIAADVWTVRIDGGKETQISDFEDPAFFPDYSPDGRRIVFSMNGDIVLMDSDGSDVVALTSHVAHETAPTFSPDGTRIAFVRFSADESTSDIFVMQADGGDLLRVTRTAGREAAPSWQPR